MRRSHKILLGVAVVAALSAALVAPQFFRSDFRTMLARDLGTQPEFLVLNIPPAPGRYPGFAFVIRGPLLPLLAAIDRKDLQEGPLFDLGARTLSRADANSSVTAGPLSALASSATDDVVTLELTQARILEADVATLKRRILADEDALRLADEGLRPQVVVRAYEARLDLHIDRGDSATAGAWAEKVALAKDVAIQSEGALSLSTADDHQFELKWSEPVVFAFEVMEARLFASHLGSAPDSVELTRVPAATLAEAVVSEATTSGSKKN